MAALSGSESSATRVRTPGFLAALALNAALVLANAPLALANAPLVESSDEIAPPLEQLQAPRAGSLYLRMGGAAKIQAIVSDLIDRAAQDRRTRRSFDKVNLRRLKSLFAAQLCELTGGGCQYDGDSMRDAHGGLGITEAEFYGLVEELRDALRAHGVGLRERNELLRILAPMKRDVVER